MRILVVGSTPSQSQKSKRPFDGARSLSTLTRWLGEIGSYDYVLANVSSEPTPGNRALKVPEYKLNELRYTILNLRPDHIIALGRTAEKALRKLEVTCIPMPHPSGLNRKLNDLSYVEAMLTSVRDWIRFEENVYLEPVEPGE